ncbi:MAG: hypothetical protein QM734_14530 [Cyclobacteriaceae bacterium]
MRTRSIAGLINSCRSQYIWLAAAFMLLASCAKESTHFKNSGFSSINDFKANPYVTKAINESGITIYDGNTPPNISGVYSEIPMSYLAKSNPNYTEYVGEHLEGLVKFANQSANNTLTKYEWVPWADFSSNGRGAYISGHDNYFTIYIEADVSGSATIPYTAVDIISGEILSPYGDLSIDAISILVSNIQGFQLGDWIESGGLAENTASVVGEYKIKNGWTGQYLVYQNGSVSMSDTPDTWQMIRAADSTQYNLDFFTTSDENPFFLLRHKATGKYLSVPTLNGTSWNVTVDDAEYGDQNYFRQLIVPATEGTPSGAQRIALGKYNSSLLPVVTSNDTFCLNVEYGLYWSQVHLPAWSAVWTFE